MVIGQGNSRGHELHVLRRMVRITFYVTDAKRAGERGADRALAGTANAHHDVEASVHDLSWGKSNRVEKTGA